MLLARLDAIKYISFKLPRYGGIYPSKRMVHVAESADIQVYMSCSKCPFDSAIGSRAELHFGASTTNATPAFDYSTHWLIDDIAARANKPGLGVEVDEKKLEKYRIPI
jgi:L-alanine-DL-glutamate epimerase-like enolase superfamily enzyme